MVVVVAAGELFTTHGSPFRRGRSPSLWVPVVWGALDQAYRVGIVRLVPLSHWEEVVVVTSMHMASPAVRAAAAVQQAQPQWSSPAGREYRDKGLQGGIPADLHSLVREAAVGPAAQGSAAQQQKAGMGGQVVPWEYQGVSSVMAGAAEAAAYMARFLMVDSEVRVEEARQGILA